MSHQLTSHQRTRRIKQLRELSQSIPLPPIARILMQPIASADNAMYVRELGATFTTKDALNAWFVSWHIPASRLNTMRGIYLKQFGQCVHICPYTERNTRIDDVLQLLDLIPKVVPQQASSYIVVDPTAHTARLTDMPNDNDHAIHLYSTHIADLRRRRLTHIWVDAEHHMVFKHVRDAYRFHKTDYPATVEHANTHVFTSAIAHRDITLYYITTAPKGDHHA